MLGESKGAYVGPRSSRLLGPSGRQFSWKIVSCHERCVWHTCRQWKLAACQCLKSTKLFQSLSLIASISRGKSPENPALMLLQCEGAVGNFNGYEQFHDAFMRLGGGVDEIKQHKHQFAVKLSARNPLDTPSRIQRLLVTLAKKPCTLELEKCHRSHYRKAAMERVGVHILQSTLCVRGWPSKASCSA